MLVNSCTNRGNFVSLAGSTADSTDGLRLSNETLGRGSPCRRPTFHPSGFSKRFAPK